MFAAGNPAAFGAGDLRIVVLGELPDAAPLVSADGGRGGVQRGAGLPRVQRVGLVAAGDAAGFAVDRQHGGVKPRHGVSLRRYHRVTSSASNRTWTRSQPAPGMSSMRTSGGATCSQPCGVIRYQPDSVIVFTRSAGAVTVTTSTGARPGRCRCMLNTGATRRRSPASSTGSGRRT